MLFHVGQFAVIFGKVGGGICDSLLQKLVTVIFVTVNLVGSKLSLNFWAQCSIMILISLLGYITTS
jgi:hypothetical protein